MEISTEEMQSSQPEIKGEALLDYLIRESKKKMAKVDIRGYDEETNENISRNFEVIVPFLEEIRGSKFRGIEELIDCLNEKTGGSAHFVQNDEDVHLTGLTGEEKFPIEEIFFEMNKKYYQKMDKEGLFCVDGVNLWNNPFNAQELFLPMSYFLQKITPPNS